MQTQDKLNEKVMLLKKSKWDKKVFNTNKTHQTTHYSSCEMLFGTLISLSNEPIEVKVRA